ncbi:uncharacterized protein [Haliotis cracherodii]|uniref:uncharacterized protein n=1 Tax=Haliotis cracherodii TaxID=6455 RepID=UPI0039ECF571
MDNTSAVSFNISDILPPQEIAAECNATNMSSGCEGHDANQTNHLFDSIQHIIEITFTCCDVLNVLGNAVLMLLICKATTKMEASSRLLVNQAVADAGMGLSWLVFYGNIYTNPQRDLPQTAILLQGVAISVFSCVSGLSFAMTLFALHIAICNPILYKVNNNPKVITIIMVVSWLVVTGCSILALTADNFLIQEDNSIIIWNVTKQNTWFVDLCCNIILPLAMMIIAFTRICLHMRKKENVSITSASATKRYVRQAKGIFVVYITYIITFCPLFVFDFININYKSDNGILLVIIKNSLSFLNYAYLVFKLPLFLLAFKSYRRVASQIFCQHLASGSSSGPSGDRGKLPQRKDQTATKINHRLDDKGHGEAARSTPIQMDEATEMKGNIGRVNHGFTSTCSLYHGDTARPNGAKDDVSSNTSDDVSNRLTPPSHTPGDHTSTVTSCTPEPRYNSHTTCTPDARYFSHTTCTPEAQASTNTTCSPEARYYSHITSTPEARYNSHATCTPGTQASTLTTCTPEAVHSSYTQHVHLKLRPPPTQHVHLELETPPSQPVHLKLDTTPSQHVHLKLKPPPTQHVHLKLDTTPTQRLKPPPTQPVHLKLSTTPTQPVHLKLKPPPTQHVHLKLETPATQRVHLKLDTTPSQHVHLKPTTPPTQHVHLKLSTTPTQPVHLQLKPHPTQHVHLKLKPPPTQHVHLQLKPPQTQPVHLKLSTTPTQHVHLKLKPLPTQHAHLKLDTTPSQRVHLKLKPPPTQHVHLELETPPSQPVHLKPTTPPTQ